MITAAIIVYAIFAALAYGAILNIANRYAGMFREPNRLKIVLAALFWPITLVVVLFSKKRVSR